MAVTANTDAEIDDLALKLWVKAYDEEKLVLNEDVLWCMLVKLIAPLTIRSRAPGRRRRP